jgi:hypothetical protein
MSYPPVDPAAGFVLAGLEDLLWIDVADPRLPEDARRQRLGQLEQIHVSFFSDHAHVCGEWEDGLEHGWPDEQVIVHLWLALFDGKPVGQVVMHTDLHRGAVLVHFVSMDERVRSILPRDWLQGLSDAFLLSGRTDAKAAPKSAPAVFGEVPPDHVHKWQRVGFHHVDIDYVEPHHGIHWPDFGPEPRYFPMSIVVRLDGTPKTSLSDVLQQGLRGYMLDHYGLASDAPEVLRVLREAGQIAELTDVD